MPDLNDLSKPDNTSRYDTEILQTLRGHISRLWSGDYTGMANLVAGMRRWVRNANNTDVKLVQRNAQGGEDTLFDSSNKGNLSGGNAWSGTQTFNLPTPKPYGGNHQFMQTIVAVASNATGTSEVVAYDFNAIDANPNFSSAILRKFGPSYVGNLYFAPMPAAGWAEIGGINVQNGVIFGANANVPIVFASAGERMRIDPSSGNITSSGGLIGYGAGAGGSAFSLTNSTTLNKASGQVVFQQITINALSKASYRIYNSLIDSNSLLSINCFVSNLSTTNFDSFNLNYKPNAGYVDIVITNNSNSNFGTTWNLYLNYVIHKGSIT